MKNLTQLMIADVMTKAPRSIEPHQSIDLARQWMDDMKVRHLPVRSGGKLVGILSERDLNLVAGLQRSKHSLQTVEDAMISEVRTVTDSRKLKDVAQEMIEHRIGCVLVVGKDESLLGIFTDTDALRILAGQG
jgi:CBS domain-containing protein